MTTTLMTIAEKIEKMMDKMRELIREEKYEQCTDLQKIIDAMTSGKKVTLSVELDWELAEFLSEILTS